MSKTQFSVEKRGFTAEKHAAHSGDIDKLAVLPMYIEFYVPLTITRSPEKSYTNYSA